MAAEDPQDMFEVGIDILNTEVSEASKKILVQTGSNSGEGGRGGDNVEWWQHVGFASRPSNPEAGKESAKAVVLRQGGQDVAFASHDFRGLSLYGNLGPGETCLYAAGADGESQARVLLKSDGSINIFTKSGNESGGSGMGIFVNADGSISIAGSEGNAVLLGSDGSVKVFNGSGGIQVKEDGHIKLASSSKVEISGASITLGGAAALPVAIGPNVVTAITALQTQIAAVAGALVACMNIPGPILPPHGAAAAAATTAVGIGTAIVASSSALIPALRTAAD